MKDPIERQAAIDALVKEYNRRYELGERGGLKLAWIENAINAVPSAEPEYKEIGYKDCANALLNMWMDEVLTDGEYSHIMDKLNAYWAERRADE